MNLAIRYFTGTGNTARVCAIIGAEFAAAGWRVDSAELESNTADAGLDKADLLLAAFPVLGFSPPRNTVRWIKRLRKARGRKAAVIAVGGATYIGMRYIPGWGADAPFAAARMLKGRGRDIIGIGEVSMPENFTQAVNTPTVEQCGKIVEINEPLARDFARRVIAAYSAPGRKAILSRSLWGRLPFSAVSFLFTWFGRPFLSRTFIADGSCSGCGLCARLCTSRAIKLKGGRPSWNLRCSLCNRCINICPSESIRTSSLVLVLQLFIGILFLAGALSLPLPRTLLPLSRVGARSLLIVGLFLVQLGPLAQLLRFLSRKETLRPLFEESFMKSFRRYRAEGFDPCGKTNAER